MEWPFPGRQAFRAHPVDARISSQVTITTATVPVWFRQPGADSSVASLSHSQAAIPTERGAHPLGHITREYAEVPTQDADPEQ